MFLMIVLYKFVSSKKFMQRADLWVSALHILQDRIRGKHTSYASSLIRATMHRMFLWCLSKQPRFLSSWNNYRFAPSCCLTTSLRLVLCFHGCPTILIPIIKLALIEKSYFLAKARVIIKITSKVITISFYVNLDIGILSMYQYLQNYR